MDSTERAIKLSEDFDKELKKLASNCESLEDLEYEISGFIDKKFEFNEYLLKKYDLPIYQLNPSEFFDTLQLTAEYDTGLPLANELEYQKWINEIKENPFAIDIVPPRHLTRELCLVCIENGGRLEDIPTRLRDEEICFAAVKKDGWALEYVPENIINYEICHEAVKDESFALQFVPEQFLTPEICRMAVEESGNALRFVPEEMRTYDICEVAGKNWQSDWEYFLKYVPYEMLDEEGNFMSREEYQASRGERQKSEEAAPNVTENNVSGTRSEAKKMRDYGEEACQILDAGNSLNSWVRDAIEGNFSEIGKTALCVDLEDGRVFRDYFPGGDVTPRDENTLVVSVYDPETVYTPKNKKEIQGMTEGVRSLAIHALRDTLKGHDQAKEFNLEQKEEQSQKKGRGR